MPNRLINPAGMPQPLSKYSQAVLIPTNTEVLHISGQLGLAPSGEVMDGFAAQMRQAMENVFTVLASTGMKPQDIVKLTVLATSNDAETVDAYRAIRDEMLGGHAPAALFAAVNGFTHPDFLVEIEAVAAPQLHRLPTSPL